MLHTTFARAREAHACISSYRKFARFKGGVARWGKDTPFPLSEVLEVCGLKDALWALQIVIEPADNEIRLFACDCAERVLPIFEKEYPNDKRPRQAIGVSRKFALGQATLKDLKAAEAAVWAAKAASGIATWATRAAARAASGAAAETATWAARAAAETATWSARAAEREWQKAKLMEMLNTSPVQELIRGH